MSRKKQIVAFVVLGVVVFLGVGCSSGPEEPSSSRTTQDTRGDSDRFFQKMEKEEQKEYVRLILERLGEPVLSFCHFDP